MKTVSMSPIAQHFRKMTKEQLIEEVCKLRTQNDTLNTSLYNSQEADRKKDRRYNAEIERLGKLVSEERAIVHAYREGKI